MLQMAGLVDSNDTLVLRGRPQDHRFTAFHFRHDRITAAHSVNRPAEHMLCRKLVATGAVVDVAQLADEAFFLKSVLTRSLPLGP